ncbi:MAG: KamA family radical SAM protein [Proteobacteria bacterium]|nr:KamA family radical SAM protein [Pseudomonadota bacterium]
METTVLPPDPEPGGKTLFPSAEFVPNRDCFRSRFYPGISQALWNDWKWQMANRITTPEKIGQILSLAPEERDALEGSVRLPMAITPYYAGLIDPDDPGQGIRRSVIPTIMEVEKSAGEEADPLHEDLSSPVPGIVHRYPDRVLFLTTGMCASYCRYCTRSRMVTDGHCPIGERVWNGAIDYIAAHPEIRDVLVSGGDPLTLSDEKLQWLLTRLRRIRHVEILRIGTKVPAVLPQRITPRLVSILKRFHPLYLSIHFIHPDELTPDCAQACARLADGGIPLGSQTVLLKGINDDVPVMKELMHRLLQARVRPYYLYQCDPIPGSAHFRTSVARGLEIIGGLRGYTSGYAVPTYVIDAPGGGGKVPLMADSIVEHGNGSIRIRNYEGKVFTYPEPVQEG